MSVSRPTTIRDRLRKQVAADKPPCWLCGEPIDYSLPHMDPMAFVIDHVVPLAHGGKNDITNVAPAHRTCNRTKGARHVSPIIRRSGALARPQRG